MFHKLAKIVPTEQDIRSQQRTSRHRLRRRSALHRSIIDTLEERRLLSVIAPTWSTDPFFPSSEIRFRDVPDGATNRVYLNWVDTNTDETGYRVEVSPNGQDDWSVLATTTSTAPPNSQGVRVQATQVLAAGEKNYYRVWAVEGTTFSSEPTPVLSPHTPKDDVVELSSLVATSPVPSVTLTWTAPDETTYQGSAPSQYRVNRKARSATSWTFKALLPGDATGYEDTDVTIGDAYEYQVLRFDAQPLASGYVYAGIEAPATEERGTVLLVVDNTQAEALSSRLIRLAQDLIGDGWRVQRIDVPREDDNYIGARNHVRQVKGMIRDLYAEHSDLNSVLLIGHVPVPYSGINTAFDGHGSPALGNHNGAWSADAYYGDMSAETLWSDSQAYTPAPNNPLTNSHNVNSVGDGKFDQIVLPSSIELAVGRIDFANLSWGSTQSETTLLQRYLDKNHAFRQKQITPQVRALIDDHLGQIAPGAPLGAEIGWRNFVPLVGAENVFAKDWTTTLPNESYLWAYGAGPGGNGGGNADGVVWDGDYRTATTETAYHAVFNLLFGSWFGDFNQSNNLLRTALASDGEALVTAWGARPTWFLHNMALGEPIGQSLIQVDNNSGLYFPGAGPGINVALMGDPTLRMIYVAPATDVEVELGASDATVTWSASADDVVGYNVYRASSGNSAYTLLARGITGTRYEDSTSGYDSDNVYMVRAVRLEQTPSGTYYNLSQGALNTPPDPGWLVTVGGSGVDSFMVRVDPTDDDNLQVTSIIGGASPITYTVAKALVTSVTINGLGGDDQFVIDSTYGVPMPGGAINFIGGGGTGDIIEFVGSDSDSSVVVAGNILDIDEQAFGSGHVVVSGVEHVVLDGSGGEDLLSLRPLVGNMTTAPAVLHIASGNYSIEGDLAGNTDDLAVVVDVGATVTFTTSQHLSAMAVNGQATLASGGDRVIITKDLAVTGRLDLKDNDLIFDYDGDSPVGTFDGLAYNGVTGLVASAYHFGAWDGDGIGTSMPAAISGLTTLGIGDAATVLSISGSDTATWSGYTVDATTVMIKYTYAGDADLGGFIDGGDYGILDNFAQVPGASAYFNGDFNFDGVIDGGDYGIIDNNVQGQGGPL